MESSELQDILIARIKKIDDVAFLKAIKVLMEDKIRLKHIV